MIRLLNFIFYFLLNLMLSLYTYFIFNFYLLFHGLDCVSTLKCFFFFWLKYTKEGFFFFLINWPARLSALFKYFRTSFIEHHLNRAIRHNANIGVPVYKSFIEARRTFPSSSNDNATVVASVRKRGERQFRCLSCCRRAAEKALEDSSWRRPFSTDTRDSLLYVCLYSIKTWNSPGALPARES